MTDRQSRGQAMTHTPGPWTYDAKLNAVLGGKETFIAKPDARTESEREANARLIAASPELLLALKDVEEYYSNDLPECLGPMIRAAIAKAEGGKE